MKTYVYKIKSKYRKVSDEILKYGFVPFQEEEGEEGEALFSTKIKLNTDGAIFKYLVKALEKIYEKATTEERETDFKDYKFTEILTEKQKRAYKVEMTPELEKELTECQLCFWNKGLGEYTLFINSPDTVAYYNIKDLDENCSEIINKMLEDGIIYKKKVHTKRRR